MVTTFNSKDLVSFGKYLLSEERKESLEQTSIEDVKALPSEERLREVYHADIQNWKDRITPMIVQPANSIEDILKEMKFGRPAIAQKVIDKWILEVEQL